MFNVNKNTASVHMDAVQGVSGPSSQQTATLVPREAVMMRYLQSMNYVQAETITEKICIVVEMKTRRRTLWTMTELMLCHHTKNG